MSYKTLACYINKSGTDIAAQSLRTNLHVRQKKDGYHEQMWHDWDIQEF